MALVAVDKATHHAGELALTDGVRSLTWAQLNETLNRAVNSLIGLALTPTQRVAVFAGNSVDTVVAHLAGLLAGVSTVPINFHLNADELAYILADSGTVVLCTDTAHATVAHDAADRAGVERVVVWSADAKNSSPTSWSDMLATSSAAEPPTHHPPRPNLMYTSGTTGFPKAVELPPTIFAGGADIGEHVDALRTRRFSQLGTHLVVGPMYHTGPLSGMRALAAGTPLVVLRKFDPEAVLAAVQTHRIESTIMVPTHFNRLLALDPLVRAAYDVSSLKLVAHTGAACPADVKVQMIDWFGPIFVDSYGATEVGTLCTISSPEWLAHRGSVGRCVAPFRALVLDDDDQPVGAGVEGRLYFEDATGRGIVYPNDPAKTAAAHVRPGVFTIGEIGYVDADGYVFITDRSSDMIVSGGVNIYPAEAERVLTAQPGVADVAVIGVPDPDMGEAVKALVVPIDPSQPPQPDALIAACRAELASYKCPRSVDIVKTIGRNAMGKVNKRALRQPFWGSSSDSGTVRTIA